MLAVKEPQNAHSGSCSTAFRPGAAIAIAIAISSQAVEVLPRRNVSVAFPRTGRRQHDQLDVNLEHDHCDFCVHRMQSAEHLRSGLVKDVIHRLKLAAIVGEFKVLNVTGHARRNCLPAPGGDSPQPATHTYHLQQSIHGNTCRRTCVRLIG